MWTYLFTNVSLFIHYSEPLLTIKERCVILSKKTYPTCFTNYKVLLDKTQLSGTLVYIYLKIYTTLHGYFITKVSFCL